MNIIAKNKKWLYDYEVIDTLDAGIVLVWHEVKSIKMKQVQLSDSYIMINNEGVLNLYNMNIQLYKFTSPSIVQWYNPKQPRQLLVTKQQLAKLYAKTKKTWFVMIPTQLWESKSGMIKVTIALAKRKKKAQKRTLIKERDTARQMDKAIKDLR